MSGSQLPTAEKFYFGAVGMIKFQKMFFAVHSLLFCVYCVGREEVSGKAGQRAVFNTLSSAVGIGIQMLNSEIRVDFMCVAIGNLLLYNHHCKI